MDLEKLRVEEIEWEDHYSTDTWADPEETDFVGSIFVKSIGRVLKETKTKVVLVPSIASNGQVFGTITILKKTIKSRTIVREGN